MFLKLIILSVIIVGIALLGLSINILFRKEGKFPETRVGHNKEMRKRKIYCVKTQQKLVDKDIKRMKAQGHCSGCACT